MRTSPFPLLLRRVIKVDKDPCPARNSMLVRYSFLLSRCGRETDLFFPPLPCGLHHQSIYGPPPFRCCLLISFTFPFSTYRTTTLLFFLPPSRTKGKMQATPISPDYLLSRSFLATICIYLNRSRLRRCLLLVPLFSFSNPQQLHRSFSLRSATHTSSYTALGRILSFLR